MKNVETEINQIMNRLVVSFRAAQKEKRITEKVLFENVFSLETKEIIFLKNFCAETVNAESV